MIGLRPSAPRVAGVRISPYVEPRRGWWLAITDRDGAHGLGDAAPHAGFGTDDPSRVAAGLAYAAEALVGRGERETSAVVTDLVDVPEAAHAVDLALLDWRARRAGVSLSRALNPAAAETVSAHLLVRDACHARWAVGRGATVLKTKASLGTVAAIRRAVGPEVRLRVDANGRWDHEAARHAVDRLAAMGVEWVEQPVADLPGLAALRGRGVAIAADEVVGRAPLEDVLDAADVVVIKPMFVGGPRAALALARRVHAAARVVCVTHALESRVGRMGAWHVAAALNLPERVHGVGG